MTTDLNVTINYGRMCDMMHDMMGTRRMRLGLDPEGYGNEANDEDRDRWCVAEHATMRCFGYLFGTYQSERYHRACDFIKAADCTEPAGRIVIALIKHMEGN